MGAISETHINPAVTIGLAVVKQISLKDAAIYLVAQFARGLAACAAAGSMVTRGTVTAVDSGKIFGAETIGAFILGSEFPLSSSARPQDLRPDSPSEAPCWRAYRLQPPAPTVC